MDGTPMTNQFHFICTGVRVGAQLIHATIFTNSDGTRANAHAL
jgi:hypothetical protein